MDVGVDPARARGRGPPAGTRAPSAGRARDRPSRARDSRPATIATQRQRRVDRAGDRLLGFRGEALAAEAAARLPLEVADERHPERREHRQEETERARLDAASRGGSRRRRAPACTSASSRNETPIQRARTWSRRAWSSSSSARWRRCADRQERGAAFDDALEAEREQGEAPRPDRLEEGEAPFPEDVDEGQAEQPVHPPAQGRAVLRGGPEPAPDGVPGRRSRAHSTHVPAPSPAPTGIQ